MRFSKGGLVGLPAVACVWVGGPGSAPPITDDAGVFSPDTKGN